MSDEFILSNFDIFEFRNSDTNKYSVWVYDDGNELHVYSDEVPNTVEIWFKFYKFNHFYWKLLEDECVVDVKGRSFYDYNKLKLFMIKRMICSTSIEGISIKYDKRGLLCQSSFERLMHIHPRILRVLMDKIDVLPKPMKKSEEKELEKQCSILFGKGEGLTDTHPYITLYCNLVAFWDKFGMNYFDILKLPQDVFMALKKVMMLDNMNKNAKMEEMSQSTHQKGQASQTPARRGGHSVKF